MIIIGTMELSFKQSKGEFFCPSCGTERPYDQKVARMFLTLYFIPLIPLQRLGEFVRCQSCKSKFETAILNYDPELERQQLYEAYLKLLTLKMITEGWVEELHLSRLRWLMSERFEFEPTDEQIFEAVSIAEESDAKYEDVAQQIRFEFSGQTRMDLMLCMMWLELVSNRAAFLPEDGTDAGPGKPESLTNWLSWGEPLGLTGTEFVKWLDQMRAALLVEEPA